MEVDTGTYTGVYERLYHLPEGFQQAYDPGVFRYFWYEDQDGPSQLLGNIPHGPHVLNYADQTHPSLRTRGGLQSLHGVSLPQPLFKILCTDVGVSARLKRAQATECCLHLRLQWFRIIELYWIHVCCQGYTKGLQFLLLIKGPEKPRDFLHISPGRVGHTHGCMPVPMFQYGVCLTKVGPAHCRIKTRHDRYFGGLGSSPRVHKKGKSHGFSDSPRHVAVMERVEA